MGKAKTKRPASGSGRVVRGIQVAPGHVAFRWTLDDEATERQAQTYTGKLRKAGPTAEIVQHQTRPFFVVIPVIIAGVVVAAALSEQVYDWWDHRHQHGLLIHVKPNHELEIKPLESLPYGAVLFIGADGTTFKYAKVSEDQMKIILDAVSKGLTPPAPSK